MRVLVITSTFPRHRNDDQVPWLAQLVLRLQKKGIRPKVYAPSYKGLGHHNYHGIDVTRFRYAPPNMEILTHEEGAVFKLREKPWLYAVALLYLVFGIIGIFRMAHQHTFDVIHVHWPFPNGIFGIIAKRLFGARLILSFHGAEFTLMRHTPMGVALLRLILKHADQVVANSLFTKRMIQEVHPMNVRIIPFSSGLSITQKKKAIVHARKNTFNILFVGRFIERKGIAYLVNAADILHKKNIPISLRIVGNGPLLGQIQKQIHRLHLGSVVAIHEHVADWGLAKFYRESDVFVLPAIVDQWNDTEGLGVVLIEAMMFGVPVIASNVGGIPSVLKHNKNGLLVPEKNSQAIAQAIEKLIQDPRLAKRLGENGLFHVKANYNWNTIIDKTLRLYRRSIT